MSKKKLVAIVLGVGILMGGGTAYALTSTDFAAQANSWANQNCQTVGNNLEKMTLCYLFNKSGEQETRIANLEAAENPAAKTLKVVINGDEFGPVVNAQQVTFFYEPVQRLVALNNYGLGPVRQAIGETVNVEYESSDCTGTPYLFYSDEVAYENKIYNHLLTAGYNLRYIVDRNAAAQTINRNSTQSFHYDTETVMCHPGGGGQISVVPLTPATVPIVEPITEHIEFVYN